MNDEFKKSFYNLSINDKRNKLSDELILIGELLKKLELKFGINSSFNIKNYNLNRDSLLTDEEMLLYIYEDIYIIQRELITVLSVINFNADNNQ